MPGCIPICSLSHLIATVIGQHAYFPPGKEAYIARLCHWPRPITDLGLLSSNYGDTAEPLCQQQDKPMCAYEMPQITLVSFTQEDCNSSRQHEFLLRHSIAFSG
jgi:hypothetical protein